MKPREKLQTQGRQALSNQELLQLLISSGNASASAARIAKRTLKQLEKHGNIISYDQLSAVSGLGPARVCQIIGAFELASRYPYTARVKQFRSERELLAEVRSKLADTISLIAITFDGADRHVSTYRIDIANELNEGQVIRSIFSDIIASNAVSAVFAHGAKEYPRALSLFDLSLARSVKLAANFFSINLKNHYTVSSNNHTILGQPNGR